MWQDIEYPDIVSIEKLVSEYDVCILEKTSYGRVKIKIYESPTGEFTGYTNLYVIDEEGEFNRAEGRGKTEETLRDTLAEYFKLVSRKDVWEEEDFRCADSFDF